MKIDLKEVLTFYINLPQHNEKRDKINGMLSNLQFKNFHRLAGYEYPETPVAGCSRAHYHSLNSENIPFILLEDDAFVMDQNWNNGIIEVPDDADAVYLGNSTWGRMNGHNGEYVQYDKIDNYPGVLRVYNMLATHAILYLKREYTDLIKRIAYHTGYVIENYNDVGFAEVQRYFKIYALDNPLFGQSSNMDATVLPITSINHTECMNTTPLQFYPYPIK
jgi:hypothetical protein